VARPLEGAKKQIVVVLPVGVPGMGKSHFAEHVLLKAFSQLGHSTKDSLRLI